MRPFLCWLFRSLKLNVRMYAKKKAKAETHTRKNCWFFSSSEQLHLVKMVYLSTPDNLAPYRIYRETTHFDVRLMLLRYKKAFNNNFFSLAHFFWFILLAVHLVSASHVWFRSRSSIPIFNGPWNLIHVYEAHTHSILVCLHAELAGCELMPTNCASRKCGIRKWDDRRKCVDWTLNEKNERTEKLISTLIWISSAIPFMWCSFNFEIGTDFSFPPPREGEKI